MKENVQVILTSDQVETLLVHFGREDEFDIIQDYEVGELVDQLIDEIC